MKTNLQKLFLLAIIFLTPNLVHAESACSYSEQAEINNIVANVRATYEAIDIYDGKVLDIDNADENGNIPEIDYYKKGFNISILNITEDIYIKVTNDFNNDVKTFDYKSSKEGIVNFQTSDIDRLITYTIEIYANKYACAGELFRKFTITTPVYNRYSKMIACKNNPDFYYCQEFLPSENITLDEFGSKIKEYEQKKSAEENQLKEKNKNWIERIKEFYTNNALWINISGIAIVVVAGVATTVILVKKKRSRVL